jgi:hypothetical protein
MATQRTEQHLIDERAKIIFREQISIQWVVNSLSSPDYHYDYLLRIFNGSDTGIDCYIQLKGSMHVKYKNKCALFKFPLKYSAVYPKSKRPVFIVLCDVVKKKCYYYNVSGDLSKGSGKVSKTIHIPVSNLVSKSVEFQDNIEKASTALINHNANDPELAIKNALSRLEALDPRMKVDGKFDHGRFNYSAVPKAGEAILIRFTAPGSKIIQMIEDGTPAKFSPGEAQFQGSPLIDIIAKDGVTFQLNRNKKIVSRLQLVNDSGKIVANLGPIFAEYNGGTKSGTITGILGDNLLTLSIRFNDPVHEGASSFNMKFNFNCWIGQDYSDLSYFDQMLSFIVNYNRDTRCLLVFEIPDGEAHNIDIGSQFLKYPEECRHSIVLLNKIRSIRNSIRLPLVYKRHFEESDEHEIETLYGFLCEANQPIKAHPLGWTFDVTQADLKKMDESGEIYKPFTVTSRIEIIETDFLGNKVQFSSFITNPEITNTDLNLIDPSSVKDFLKGNGERTLIKFETTENSKAIYRNDSIKPGALAEDDASPGAPRKVL